MEKVEHQEPSIEVFENDIDYYFKEYFEKRNISLVGLDYKKIDNSVFEAAFRYVYRHVFKPDRKTIRYNNKNTKIDLKDIEQLEDILNIYIDLVKDYNIKPFQYFFTDLTGISKDTLNSWLKEEYKHDGLSSRYSDLVKKINQLSSEQIQNNLADNPIGVQSLANNDDDVNLKYIDKNFKRCIDSIPRLQASELPKLGTLETPKAIE